jgi:hypothetical protein
MPWADNENVTAILTAHYPGEEIGNAVVDVLWGEQEPSGRLPYTIPRAESDYGPTIANITGTAYPSMNFTEGQLIDYKHFVLMTSTHSLSSDLVYLTPNSSSTTISISRSSLTSQHLLTGLWVESPEVGKISGPK